MKKRRRPSFSVVKAVKSNARDRVGMPPPSRVLPDPKARGERRPRHPETLADLLARRPDDEA